jgi:CelD/BcsL family acetyltransferase involved in cellulose biosynthesis
MHFEWLELDDLTPQILAEWRALGFAASTPNAYLMPEFMLPAIRYLGREETPSVAALWDRERRTLLALGVFDRVAPSWRFPIPRLSAFKSKHSFQAGVLLRAGIGADAVDRFVDSLVGGSWSAIRFNELREDALVYRQLQESARRLGLSWFVDQRYRRAALDVDEGRAWCDHIPRSRHRRLRRARTQLAALGKVRFRIVEGTDIRDSETETFLQLESSGWKGKSALAARTRDTQFFREMARGCREQNLLYIYELLLDDAVIASTTNFRVNGHGFAFKTGSDPAYRKVCPGFLVEYEFLEQLAASEAKHGLREIESGSEPGSFMEELWPKRIPIVNGHLFAGKLPTFYARVRQSLRRGVGTPPPARPAPVAARARAAAAAAREATAR